MSDICITCHKRVRGRQHGVECDSCGLWNHRTCSTGITIDDYREAVRTGSDLVYMCPPCAECKHIVEEAVNEIESSIGGDSTVFEDFSLSLPSSRDINGTPDFIDNDNSVRVTVEVQEQITHDRSLIDPSSRNQPVPAIGFEGSQNGRSILCDALYYYYTIKERKDSHN